jgi:2-iminoacetate synthase ThiH
MFAPLMKLTLDTTLLAMEAQTVIGIRLTQLAIGRGTHAEVQLMVTEKMLAFAEAGLTLATGGSAQRVVSGYRKHVRANVRRLEQ